MFCLKYADGINGVSLFLAVYSPMVSCRNSWKCGELRNSGPSPVESSFIHTT